jgi:hypothetical protein
MGLSASAHKWKKKSYKISIGYGYCAFRLVRDYHDSELPEGAIRPKWKRTMNVVGCGLLLDPTDQLAIFFTLNGKLLGEFLRSHFKIIVSQCGSFYRSKYSN